MPKGLAIPVRVNQTGGALLVEGDENDHKIISMALGADDNENAFNQGVALGVDMIFDNNDAQIRPRIVGRLRQIFNRFEQLKRYKLRENTVKWLEKEGELILEFMYVNMESDEEKTFRRQFRGSQQGERT